MNPIIKSMTMHFEEKEKEIEETENEENESNVKCPIMLFTDPEYTFGIVKIDIQSNIPIITKPLHILFTIDASGSMSDICSDGRTKMRHILFTLENMLQVLHKKPDNNISVYIQSFSTSVEKIVKTNKLCEENMVTLIQKIMQIVPTASTNIEAALQSANSYIDLYKTENPTHEVIHLFLTDGEITSGEPNKEILKKLIRDNCTTTFIGYGTSHDSELLSFISSEQNNEYRFIDALEKAGLVYGEILHGILYKAIENVTLCGTNCELYNYITNEWCSDLYIGNLLSEQSKIYHIRTKTPNEWCVINLLEKDVMVHRCTSIHSTSIHSTSIQSTSIDINDYKFRQRTQELLYEARQLSIHKNKKSTIFNFNEYIRVDEIADIKSILKCKLKEFIVTLTKYMAVTNRNNDAFLKNLCDDIYIANKTLGTKWGNMYTAARQTSQGRQQTYNCNHIDDLTIDNARVTTPSRIQRQTSMMSSSLMTPRRNVGQYQVGFDSEHENDGGNVGENENVIDNYTLTQDTLSPYASNTVTQLMREVSGSNTINII